MQTPALSPYSEEMMTKVLHQVPSCIKNMSVYRMKTSKIDALFEACGLEKEQLPKAHSTQLWSFRSRRPKASCQRNLRRCRLGALAKRLLKCACAKTWILFRSITMSQAASFGNIFGNQSFPQGSLQAKTNIRPTVVHLFSPPSFHSMVVAGG